MYKELKNKIKQDDVMITKPMCSSKVQKYLERNKNMKIAMKIK